MSGIVIEKVRKSFDTKDGVVEALKDVNLNIDSGDIYGIIGMSGAGKSTGIEEAEGRNRYDLPAFQSADAEVSDR